MYVHLQVDVTVTEETFAAWLSGCSLEFSTATEVLALRASCRLSGSINEVKAAVR